MGLRGVAPPDGSAAAGVRRARDRQRDTGRRHRTGGVSATAPDAAGHRRSGATARLSVSDRQQSDSRPLAAGTARAKVGRATFDRARYAESRSGAATGHDEAVRAVTAA